MNTISSIKVPGLTEDKCVTLIGMAGAGKSTGARAVAERLGWAYVDTDYLIESTYGARLQDVTDALDKESFLDVEAKVILSLRMQRAVLATGGSVVYRPEAMRYLASLGPVVFLDVPLPIILERIARKPDRGLAIAPGQTWKIFSMSARRCIAGGPPAASRRGTSAFPRRRMPFSTPLPGTGRPYERTGLRRTASSRGPAAALDGAPCRRCGLPFDRRLAVPRGACRS